MSSPTAVCKDHSIFVCSSSNRLFNLKESKVIAVSKNPKKNWVYCTSNSTTPTCLHFLFCFDRPLLAVCCKQKLRRPPPTKLRRLTIFNLREIKSKVFFCLWWPDSHTVVENY
ncbi:hypothetical protein QQP08_014055 [Theobroma cacao]|uniref:Uncharacterized protein n=1 Tax=Theobroma cacao TaxID=3641 RepID=A0A061ETG8_THECC|nr:Uncharacterized protein TCM_020559 [Theobroma cacao]WRX21568.1 hypothetical protein QQP08_014055 [Theobroma cacao]